MGLLKQMYWEKMMIYFDRLLFKRQFLKPCPGWNGSGTNYMACLIHHHHGTENHSQECGQGDSRGGGRIFYFESFSQIVLEFKAKFLQLSVWRRGVTWSWTSFSLRWATTCMRKRGEVICIKVQPWDIMLCLFLHFAFNKTYSEVKAKVKFPIKASSSVVFEFHGSHTLFTSTPCLIGWLVRRGRWGDGCQFSVYTLSAAAST